MITKKYIKLKAFSSAPHRRLPKPLHEFLHLHLHHLAHTHALHLGQCLQSLVFCLTYMKRDNEPFISIRVLTPQVDMTS
ncbi:MAG: hypothetical protein AB9903_06190 [Vulcanimicrobiota bacterium]